MLSIQREMLEVTVIEFKKVYQISRWISEKTTQCLFSAVRSTGNSLISLVLKIDKVNITETIQ
jgi:hypothetical protein